MNDYIVLDFETTNLDKGDATNAANRVVLACWYDGRSDRTYHVGGSLYDIHAGLVPALKSGRLVAHNAKFELQWLSRLGFEWEELRKLKVWDTMLADFVLAGNRRWELSLEACVKRAGIEGTKTQVVKKLMEGGVCPSEIPSSMLLEYCLKDVELTKELFQRQVPKIREAGLSHIQRNRCETCVTLAEIELQGLPLGEDEVNAEAKRIIQRHEELQAELDSISGGLNWDSPKQVAKFIYGTLGFGELKRSGGEVDRTDAGNPKTDEDTITRLRGTTAHQKAFLNLYREFVPLKKRRQTVEKLKAIVGERSRLYAGLNQTVTQTHRLSSTGKRQKVQLQNIARDQKRLVVSDHEDFYIAESDGVQLEFRAAVHMGRDKVGLKDILEGKDIHKFSGSQIFNIPEDKVVGEIRTDAKAETFRPLYGATGGSEGQKRYAEAFRKRYFGVYTTQKGWTYEVLGNKKLRTEYGLVFYWPDTAISRSGYVKNTTNIFNYPVQGFATAEIIPISLNCLRNRLSNKKSYLINTVHDSVIGMVHKEEVQEYAEACRKAFTVDTYEYLHKNYGIQIQVPLGVEIKMGKYWGDDSVYKEKYEENPKWLKV